MYLNARGMDIKKLDVFWSAWSNSEQNQFWIRCHFYVYRYENDSLKINLGKTFLPIKVHG